MDDCLFARDEDFDYLHESLPPTLESVLGDQTQRARKILQTRSAAELDYGFESLNWLLGEGSRVFSADFVRGVYGDEAFTNRPKVLRALAPRFDLVDQSAFPQATWAEYFALLALACTGEQLYMQKQPLKLPPALQQIYDQDALARHHEQELRDAAVEAMEAVCIAEQLQAEAAWLQKLEAVSAEAAAKLREAGQQGGRVRAKPFNDLRKALLDYYDQHLTERSNRGAAKQLCNKFAADIAAVLRTDEPAHQIEKWIGQHRKRSAIPPASKR